MADTTLTEREQTILDRRAAGESFPQIGRLVGLSAERVSQIHRALTTDAQLAAMPELESEKLGYDDTRASYDAGFEAGIQAGRAMMEAEIAVRNRPSLFDAAAAYVTQHSHLTTTQQGMRELDLAFDRLQEGYAGERLIQADRRLLVEKGNRLAARLRDRAGTTAPAPAVPASAPAAAHAPAETVYETVT